MLGAGLAADRGLAAVSMQKAAVQAPLQVRDDLAVSLDDDHLVIQLQQQWGGLTRDLAGADKHDSHVQSVRFPNQVPRSDHQPGEDFQAPHQHIRTQHQFQQRRQTRSANARRKSNGSGCRNNVK